MAGYTLVNLKEIEDQAPKGGLSPGLEARFAREALGLERLGVSYQRLEPGFRLPFGHRHEQQEEVYVVLAGSARAKLGDEVVELRAWDALRVPAEPMRGFEAGAEGVELLAIGAPLTEPPGGDVQMTPGWWSD
jgi:mannose-6-phosphate isomerase-like protein (cupin superfamily)